MNNPKVQQLVLNDPQLRQDLMEDPAKAILQNKPLRDAVLSDPEIAKNLNLGTTTKSIQEGLQKLASDPEVQRQLKDTASRSGELAVQGLKVLGTNFKKYVEEGPAGNKNYVEEGPAGNKNYVEEGPAGNDV